MDMGQDLEQAVAQCVKDLGDARAGWVLRRDAAESLGKVARQALQCLSAHREEPDQDVRRAITQALADVQAGNLPPAPGDAHPAYSMEELARACEKPGKRMIEPHGDGYLIRVQTSEKRMQAVQIHPFAHSDGAQYIRIHTFCAEADAKAIGWAMRANAKLPHCAFAVHGHEGKEWIILVYNFSRDRAKPEDLKEAVKAIAYYGDWFEQRLTGLDEF